MISGILGVDIFIIAGGSFCIFFMSLFVLYLFDITYPLDYTIYLIELAVYYIKTAYYHSEYAVKKPFRIAGNRISSFKQRYTLVDYSIEFDKHDLWFGVYWKSMIYPGWSLKSFHIYFILIPCFPLHIVIWKKLVI